MIGRG
ncbi:hypothetical protein V1478_018029 [Vespula squamosa]